MAENLPFHMFNNEEEIINNKSNVSELYNNEEKIEHVLASETSFDSDFDEEDDEFQVSLVVPQQPLIPPRQQHGLHPRLFYNICNQTRWNICPPALPTIVPNEIINDPKFIYYFLQQFIQNFIFWLKLQLLLFGTCDHKKIYTHHSLIIRECKKN